jgi:hypothetical protein
MVGQFHATTSSEIRGYSAVPDILWNREYYNPVGGFAPRIISGLPAGNTDLYLYNPHPFTITISYEDSVGTGSFDVSAESCLSYSDGAGRTVPQDSGVRLQSTSTFWGIGSADTESLNFDWGYSLVPAYALTDDYYLGWAPGSSDPAPAVNGSPVFVTPVQDNTTVYVDYSPTNGTVDATFVLNRLDSQKIFDPDNENTGMHIWATGPIAVAWGQDPDTALRGRPYLDLGYTTLPLRGEWRDPVLGVIKWVDPNVVPAGPGNVTTVTLTIPTYAFIMSDVIVTDTLSVGWGYVPDSTIITWPDGTVISSTQANPAISGQVLTWGPAFPLPNVLPVTATMTIVFQAQTTDTTPPGPNTNEVCVSGRNGDTITICDTAPVLVSSMDIDKDTLTPIITRGGVATYTVVLNTSGLVTDVTVSDVLTTGFTYLGGNVTSSPNVTRTSTTDPSPGDSTLNWGMWDIGPTATLTITFGVRVARNISCTTYDNSVSAETPKFGEIDDDGYVGQDPGTPAGRDPEDDEDVQVTGCPVPPDIDKDTLTPNVIPGGVATFTVVVNTSGLVTDVVVRDVLTTGFTYLGGNITSSPNVTRTSITDPSPGDSALNWGMWDIGPTATLTITFGVRVDPNIACGTYDNSVSVETPAFGVIDDDGYVGQDPGTPAGQDPEDDEDVRACASPPPDIDKDTLTRVITRGDVATYTVVLNTSGLVTDVVVRDVLTTGFTYLGGNVTSSPNVTRTSTTNPIPGDSALNWGMWDIGPTATLTITFGVRVSQDISCTTYDNSVSFETPVFGVIDDDGYVGQDRDTPAGRDPEDDEDVEVRGCETLVNLLYFRATPKLGAVLLEWETAVEVDNYGFSIRRSTSGKLADAQEVAFVPAAGYGHSGGAVYRFWDTSANGDVTYTYWLVDVDTNGHSTVHPPVEVTTVPYDGTLYHIYLPILGR